LILNVIRHLRILKIRGFSIRGNALYRIEDLPKEESRQGAAVVRSDWYLD
jgi:hypothetical protein